MADLVAISNAAANAAGIPPLLLLACACAESGLDPFARRPTASVDDARYWPDVSGGAWQQTVRWDPEYHGVGEFPGSAEIERILTLQYDPERSARIAATNLAGKYFPDEDDAVFKALCRYNWPGGHGQPASADVAANYRNGIAEATTLLGADPVPAPTYSPTTPIDQQQHDWDCAEQSSNWGITALGRHPSDAWIEQQMLADGIESTALGLLDGTGAALAGWITRQYSDPSEGTPTLKAVNAASVSFDDVRSVAGTTSVLIGGHHWGAEGHWSGVRGYDSGNDVLLLANPADGYGGVHQSMTRQQFNQAAPFSMVVIRADGAPVPPPPPAPDPLAEVRLRLMTIRDQAEAALALLEV